MKTIQLALAAAALVFGSHVQAGPLYPNKTVDISLDGYCEGLHLIINHSSGLVTGNATGCVSNDPLAGVAGGLSKTGAGVAAMNQGHFWVIDDAGRNWAVYNAAGAAVNSGTYSVGIPVFVPGQAMSRRAVGGQ